MQAAFVGQDEGLHGRGDDCQRLEVRGFEVQVQDRHAGGDGNVQAGEFDPNFPIFASNVDPNNPNSLTTPVDRIKQLANPSRGFVYAVTVTGITGGSGGTPTELSSYLDKISAVSKVPVCAGFGIREAADVAAVGKHAAGAIVGSALVEILERKEDPASCSLAFATM